MGFGSHFLKAHDVHHEVLRFRILDTEQHHGSNFIQGAGVDSTYFEGWSKVVPCFFCCCVGLFYENAKNKDLLVYNYIQGP